MSTRAFLIILILFTLAGALLIIQYKKNEPEKSKMQVLQDSLIFYSEQAKINQDSAKHYAQLSEYFKERRDSISYLVYLNSPSLDPYRDSLRTAIRRKIEAKARSNTGN